MCQGSTFSAVARPLRATVCKAAFWVFYLVSFIELSAGGFCTHPVLFVVNPRSSCFPLTILYFLKRSKVKKPWGCVSKGLKVPVWSQGSVCKRGSQGPKAPVWSQACRHLSGQREHKELGSLAPGLVLGRLLVWVWCVLSAPHLVLPPYSLLLSAVYYELVMPSDAL